MTILTPDTLILPALAGRAVSSSLTGLRPPRARSFRPKARTSYMAPVPTAGRHVAAGPAPSLLVAVARATITAAALMVGLDR